MRVPLAWLKRKYDIRMLSLTAALLIAPNMHKPVEDTFFVTVDEDVWVYPHASDPGGDSALRVWGLGGKAVAPTPADAENYSYGFLKFAFNNVPADKKLVGAYMFLKPTGKPEIDPASKDWPLEVRPLKGKFDEKSWTQEQLSSTSPSETEVYGSGVVALTDGPSSGEKEYEIKIDLLGKDSKFSEAVLKAIKDKQPMFLALTSKYDVSEMGMKGVYKVFSKDNKSEMDRPRIVLKFE